MVTDLSALADHTRSSVRTSGTSLDQDEKKVQDFKFLKSTNFVKIGQYFDNKVKRAIRSHSIDLPTAFLVNELPNRQSRPGQRQTVVLILHTVRSLHLVGIFASKMVFAVCYQNRAKSKEKIHSFSTQQKLNSNSS